MGLIQLTENLRLSEPASVCLGTFDGVHLAHQQLIRDCVEEAEKRGLVPTAFTFERPPAMLMQPDRSAFLLTSLKQKEEILSSLGIQRTVYAFFTPAFAGQPYDVFFERVLLEQLKAKHIVIGFHYRFGKNAIGNAEIMQRLCVQNGITCHVIPPVLTKDGTLVSSTAVRQCILEGNRARAEEMLGRKLFENEEKMLGGT